MEEEIERLKRDKNVLMQELIRLRQQQQTADHQLQTLGKRLHGMEHRQQLMMSFLAKAMHKPELFAQLVQQNENNCHIAGVKKKRRLPRQESSSLEEKSASPDGQIIKYQPLMNDSTTSMLAQMLNFDPSSRLEEPLNNSDSLLVDNFPSPPEALNLSSSMDQNCGDTLAEVPQNPEVPPFMPVSSGFSTACSSSAASDEIQSAEGVADMTMAGVLQDISMLSPVPVAIPCEFPEMQGMVPDESVGDIPIENFIVPEGESMYLNQIATGVDDSMPIEETVDDRKLSDIMDSLLEEFIAASPQTGETEEVVSSIQEAVEMQQSASGSKCENARNMDNLTAQMGLLASDSTM